MTRTLFHSLGFALALALCAAPLPLSAPDAYAGQTITIENETIDDDVYGNGTPPDGAGSPSQSEAEDYHVIINSGGTVNDIVFGGSAVSASGSATATATDNSVFINGGDVTDYIYGGRAQSASGSATASGNTVTINNGTVDGYVYGGSASSTGGTATATGNTVFINGGEMGYDVIGGFAETATRNSVTITGSPDLAAADLYGGYDNGSGTGDVFSGNTLNLHSPISVAGVAGVANFERLNFYLPTTLAADGAMLTVTGTADLTENNGSGRSSIVNVGIDGASSPLAVNDQVILIDASQGSLTTNSGLNTTANGQGMQGVTLKYEFDIATANNQLLATVTKAGANEQAKALSEGFLADLILVNQGADLAAGQGMSAAVRAARIGLEEGYGASAFGTVSGGWSRYDTGSHVDMKSVSLMTGLSFGAETALGPSRRARFSSTATAPTTRTTLFQTRPP